MIIIGLEWFETFKISVSVESNKENQRIKLKKLYKICDNEGIYELMLIRYSDAM